MKRLIHYLSIIFAVAFLVAGIVYLWSNRLHYGMDFEWRTPEEILADYTVTQSSPEQLKTLTAPELPDLSPYSRQAILDKMPQKRSGIASIKIIQDGYRKMRGQVAFFGERQGYLDPLTIVIEDGVYDLDMLTREINNATLLKKGDDGRFHLFAALIVEAGATLIIQDNILLLSNTKAALLASFGDIFIIDSEVKGWNTDTDEPALYSGKREDYRPHYTAWCGSKTYMTGSKFAHLGYQASKAYGITMTACNDTLYREDYGHLPGATGWIVDNEFHDIYFGFYSYEADNVVIVGNLYQDNIVYAIDPHDRSRHLIIAYNTTRGAKEKHGIIVSREVSDSFIFKNLSEQNEGSGIMIDRNSRNNVIAYNIAQRNKQDGLTIYESPDNLSYQNTLIYNEKSGLRIRNSWNVISHKDIINFNQDGGVRLYSLYLTPQRGATYRDLDLDPYIQKAVASIVEAEMVGNEGSNFNLEDFEYLHVIKPQLYRSPGQIFGGEVKPISDILSNRMNEGAENILSIEYKKKKIQNLIRTSEEPRNAYSPSSEP